MRVVGIDKHWYGDKYSLVALQKEEATLKYKGREYTVSKPRNAYFKFPVSQASFIVGSDVPLQDIVNLYYDDFVEQLLDKLSETETIQTNHHNLKTLPPSTPCLIFLIPITTNDMSIGKIAKLALQGNRNAMFSLAYYYYFGNPKLKMNDTLSYIWFNIYHGTSKTGKDSLINKASEMRDLLYSQLGDSHLREWSNIQKKIFDKVSRNIEQAQLIDFT